MKEILGTKLGRRFLRTFVITSLLPLLVMGCFLIWRADVLVREQTHEILRAASDGVSAQLREFLHQLRQVTVALAGDPRFVAFLTSESTAQNGNPTEINSVLASQLRENPAMLEFSIADRTGRVVASSNPSRIGENVSVKPYFAGGLKSFYPGDITREGNKDPIEWVMSAPVGGGQRAEAEGVVICRANPASLSDLMTGRRMLEEGADKQSFQIGATGESYIVNDHELMITESRSIPNAVLNVKVDTKPVRAALQEGKEITGKYADYRGVMVDGASDILTARHWVMLSEIDFSQAFVPVRNLRWALALMAGALLLLVTIVAALWARKILVPMEAVRVSDEAFFRGQKKAAIVPEESLPGDEIGDFVRNRNMRIIASYVQERRLLEEQKKRAETETELDVMSYSMVHDMRAPLRAIACFADILESDAGGKLSPEERGYLSAMMTAARRMDSLICDILNYSMIVRSELPLRRVDLAKVFQDTLMSYPLLRDVADKIAIPPDLPIVHGNEAGLCQCFSCLLENAVKYANPGEPPRIEIRVEKKGGWARIIVADHGLGIPQEGRDKIFGIFQRGSTSFAGNGMGLALVRKTAERMGARVGFSSECGQGSEFWLELPLA